MTDEDRRRFAAWGEAVLEDWVGDDPHRHAVQKRAIELLGEMRAVPETPR